MATSTIKKSGYGSRVLITLPYTAQKDGVVHIYGTTSQVSGGTSTLYIQCGSSANYGFAISNISSLGGAFTGDFIVKAGEEVKATYSHYISGYSCYFIPFE